MVTDYTERVQCIRIGKNSSPPGIASPIFIFFIYLIILLTQST